MKYLKGFVLMAAVGSLPQAAPAQGDVNSFLEQFVGRSLILRERVNESQFFYHNDKWDSYWFFEDDRHYLYREPFVVTIGSWGQLSDGSNGLWFSFTERIVGRQRVTLRGPDEDGWMTVLPAIWEHIFVLGGDEYAFLCDGLAYRVRTQ